MMSIFYAGFWLLSYYNNVMLAAPAWRRRSKNRWACAG